ncbi:MAG TPA: MerR family transcriptional regulator [Polyangiaceae bacterium]|jgi:DNA-binding transcriptional MerR regulator|nr:MerR family transcriptional regulator [Polyangiaceae bacterium]
MSEPEEGRGNGAAASAGEASRGSLPPKLYFRIGEVAELVGVEPHVLRYWEREFRSIRPTKSAKGQRVYSRRDVENLLRVRELLYREGFTIAGAKKKLQRTGVEPREAVESSAEDAGKIREQLAAMRVEIEAFLAELGPTRR